MWGSGFGEWWGTLPVLKQRHRVWRFSSHQQVSPAIAVEVGPMSARLSIVVLAEPIWTVHAQLGAERLYGCHCDVVVVAEELEVASAHIIEDQVII